MLVQLSDQISAGAQRLETNSFSSETHYLVTIDVTISIWTARVVKQVKKNPQFSR